jgi:hypothetical protein
MKQLKRGLSIVAAVGALASCGIVGPSADKVCTLIGCSSGLTVHLAARPVGTYRVEVFSSYPGQQPAYIYECSAIATCPQDIFFQDLIVDHPFVRVTTSVGTRTTEVTKVPYADFYPNGAHCGPPCRNATITVEIP